VRDRRRIFPTRKTSFRTSTTLIIGKALQTVPMTRSSTPGNTDIQFFQSGCASFGTVYEQMPKGANVTGENP
jgi:hypothetical protein